MYIPLIIGAVSLIERLVPLIQQWREAAKQNGEMTPQQDSEFDQKIKDVTSQPWWKPESVVEAPAATVTTTTTTTVAPANPAPLPPNP